MTVTEFRPGDDCRVVECDPAARRPLEGGRSLAAAVEGADGEYAQARIETGALWPFHRETGWSGMGDFRWRLVPGDDPACAGDLGQEAARCTVTLDITSPDTRHALTQALEDYAARERDTAEHEGGNESRERWADLADRMRAQAEAVANA